jgi:FkbM family methyltransferase
MRLSYAQNLEDVHLDGIFTGVTQGVYVDVGGGHPVADNVSFHAYLKGWHGLVVEPQERLAAAYAGIRPRDVVETCLAGRESGTMTFHMVEGLHGLSSTSAAHAVRAQDLGAATRQVTKPVRRLSDLIDAARLGTIQFLKVDVEGAEADVFAGLDLSRHRPQVILVEAVNPNNPTADVSGFEPGLLAAEYRFVFFDGLNRFYLASEAGHLAARVPTTPVAWDAVGHLWDWGRAADRPTHPDRRLADVLIAGLLAELPMLAAQHPNLLRAVVERGLTAVVSPSQRIAPRLADLMGTGEQPGAPAEPSTLDDLLASDHLRAALGRIACMYDGGHLLE